MKTFDIGANPKVDLRSNLLNQLDYAIKETEKILGSLYDTDDYDSRERVAYHEGREAVLTKIRDYLRGKND